MTDGTTAIVLASIAIVPTMATLWIGARQKKRADETAALVIKKAEDAAEAAAKAERTAAAAAEKSDKIYKKVDGQLSEVYAEFKRVSEQFGIALDKVGEVTEEAARLREKISDPAQPMPPKTAPLAITNGPTKPPATEDEKPS